MALVVYAVGRFAWGYAKLRRNKQLNLLVLAELDRRTALRRIAIDKKQQARKLLEEYLSGYPLDRPADRRRLAAAGLKADAVEQLTRVRGRLLDADRWSDSDAWFAAFKQDYQGLLEAAAKERVAYWARRAGVVTAVLSNTFADAAGVLYCSFAMLGDLCRIYNLRVGRVGTAVLLTRVFVSGYVAGQLNDLENMSADEVTRVVAPELPVGEVVATRVIGKMSGKVATGMANYFIMTRLGAAARRLLQPVAR